MENPPRGQKPRTPALIYIHSFIYPSSYIAACGETRLGQKVRIRQRMQSLLPMGKLVEQVLPLRCRPCFHK
jgi:hypothetical protein